MNKIALIHCGCHKTGSTTIQHILKKNEKKIDFYIPQTYRLNYYPINHAPLAWEILKDIRFKDLSSTLSKLKEEVKNKEKIMLSSEDFALVLSNEKMKKKFEEIFSDFNIIYICFIRTDSTRDLTIINEFRYHYKYLKKLNIFRDLLKLKKFGYVSHNIYPSYEKSYYFTSHKLLIKNFKKNTKSKFFFLNFDYKNNVLDVLKKINLFKNIEIDKNYLNSRKSKKIYNFIKFSLKSKKIYINKNRNFQKISILNKILDD